uniref:F-box domain-containing protein n=1 Tax=Oryza punctata TaxID=4537 RepID=A0A0E0MG22_ORYPU
MERVGEVAAVFLGGIKLHRAEPEHEQDGVNWNSCYCVAATDRHNFQKAQYHEIVTALKMNRAFGPAHFVSQSTPTWTRTACNPPVCATDKFPSPSPSPSPSPDRITATMTGGVDRISALPDDLIQRILRFAPANEAASTSVLSARWRSLWRSTGAVNLAVRLPEPDHRHGYQFRYAAVSSCHHAFVHSAQAAFDAAAAAATGGRGRHVTRLTLHLQAATMGTIDSFVHTARSCDADADAAPDVVGWVPIRYDAAREVERWEQRQDVVRYVVSHSAARRVEELRVTAAVGDSCSAPAEDDDEVEILAGVFDLDLSYVPLETLRVLDLTGCSRLHHRSPTAAVETPRLTTLRLKACAVNLQDLQGVIDAAPALATVHLDSVSFDGMEHGCYRLRLPAATALVLARCKTDVVPYGRSSGILGTSSIEIDAPRLRSFKYAGYARRFSLTSPPAARPGMERADLHFFDDIYASASTSRDLFWRFLHSFHGVRALKLKVSNLKHIAVAGRATRAELLVPFPNVEHLELAGYHDPASETAAVAIANLLRCCPAVRHLVLRLSTSPRIPTINGRYGRDLLRAKQQADLAESLDRFARRRKPKLPPPAVNSMDEHLDRAGEIVGLSGRSFTCMKNSLRRVCIQFRMDQPNCIGVRLIKFFAENAIHLEEMHIDDGSQRMYDHINHMVERWISDSSAKKRAKHEISAGSSEGSCNVPVDSKQGIEASTPHFRLLPLGRR